MKKITLLLLIMIGAMASSQHRFFYECRFKLDSLSEEHEKAFFILDVNENDVKFYNSEYYYNDSINKKNGYNDSYEYTYQKLDFLIKKKRHSSNYINYVNHTPYYYQFKTEDNQEWKILGDTKKIRNIEVQKAETSFGGRKWIAWFAPEIPIVEGPYKFHNLPGLILEVYDNKGDYIFSFVGSKNLKEEYDTTHFMENNHNIKPIEISEEKWYKEQLDFYNNPMKGFLDSGLYVEDENGVKKKVNVRETIRHIQARLRKDNNPIELNKAVQYPKND